MARTLRAIRCGVALGLLLLAGCGERGAAQERTNGARAEVRQRLGGTPAELDTTTAARLSGAFRAAAERALPAVVYVQVQGRRDLAPLRTTLIAGLDLDWSPGQYRSDSITVTRLPMRR